VKSASLVRKLQGWKGDARLYVLSETVRYGDEGNTTSHIVVSKVGDFYATETYIFPSD
jgi:hypothetical protein